MNNNISNIKFFLGANTPTGFVSRFDQLYNPKDSWFCYILKGGPGTGKSTLMKKVALEAKKHKIESELIYCASDPDSLDAVIFPSIKFCIVDGTSPHTLDPIYPGASDKIINLGQCWSEEKLYNSKDEIIELSERNSNFHKISQRYLAAFGTIDKDIQKIIYESLDKAKLQSYSKRLAKKLFKPQNKGPVSESVKFIGAITPKGTVLFEDTLSEICEHIYTIDDDYGIISNIILSSLRRDALNSGYNVITCYSPLSPKDRIESLIIPELKIGFATSNLWHPIVKLYSAKKIRTKRFLDSYKLSLKKQRLSFNRKIAKQLLDEAINNLNRAKSTHDSLEQLYIKAMDYKKLNSITNKIIKDIFK